MNKILLVGILVTLLPSLSLANAVIETNPLAIESYARQFNVSEIEAQKRLKIMAQNDEIISKLNNEFGDSIGSIFYDNGKNFKLVVRTTKQGIIQRQITDLLNQISNMYGLEIEVIANHPRNFKSVQNIISNQGDRIKQQYPSLQLIGYNPQQDAIFLAFYESNPNAQEHIKKHFGQLSGMDTIIKFLDSSIVPASIIGGGAIKYGDGQAFGCTAGFTGTMHGKSGFLTATHCITEKTPISYSNRLWQQYSFGTFIRDYSAYHEVSFIPVTSGTIIGEVYQYLDGRGLDQAYKNNLKITGLGVVNTNNAYKASDVGQLQLCHIGQSTGYSCGTVIAVNVGGGGCNATLPGRDHRKCQPAFFVVDGLQHKISKGDSGGPYFDSSGKAYGIASATSHGDKTQTLGIISPINYIVQSGFQLKLGN